MRTGRPPWSMPRPALPARSRRYRERQGARSRRRVVRNGDPEALGDRAVRRDRDRGGATDRPAGRRPNRELGPRHAVVAVVDQTCGNDRRGAGVDRGRSVESGVPRADRANDGEAPLQRQVGQCRGVSEVDLELAVGHDPAVGGVVPVRQIVAAQNEPHRLRLAEAAGLLSGTLSAAAEVRRRRPGRPDTAALRPSPRPCRCW